MSSSPPPRKSQACWAPALPGNLFGREVALDFASSSGLHFNGKVAGAAVNPVATCDAISSSLDDRKKCVAQLEAAKAVGTSNKLRTRKEAKKTADAFNEAARNRWTQRSIELRQQIQAAYAKIATAGTP